MIVVCQADAGDLPLWTLNRTRDRVPALDGHARVAEIVAALTTHPRVRVVEPDAEPELTEAILTTVHDPEYLRFLTLASTTATREQPIMAPEWAAPGVEPDTPICTGSAEAASSALSTALSAALWLTRGARFAYALCRPPGRHAGRDSMGGYCYVHNAAGAATFLLNGGARAGILEIDFTTETELGRSSPASRASGWSRSTHRPSITSLGGLSARWTPDRAAGNSPILHRQSNTFAPSTMRWSRSKRAVTYCTSIGYDIVWGDPHGDWSLPPIIFNQIGERLQGTGMPVCMIQEGGYGVCQLGRCAAAFATGFAAHARAGEAQLR